MKSIVLLFLGILFLTNCSSIKFNTCKDAGLETNGESYTYTCGNLIEVEF